MDGGPAPDKVKLLDKFPSELRCPLEIVDDHPYPVVWLACEVTKAEYTDKHGNVHAYSRPLVTTETRRFVVRDDGVIYGKDSRRELIDDLWAIGLKYTTTMRDYNRRVGTLAPLQARRLEPWRGILSVALWLQELGVDGLYDRMVEVTQNYQAQQAELVSSDHSSVVIRAIIRCVADMPLPESRDNWVLTVAAITGKVRLICNELDQNTTWTKVKTVGRILSQLRFELAPRAGAQGSRPRLITRDQLEHWSKA